MFFSRVISLGVLFHHALPFKLADLPVDEIEVPDDNPMTSGNQVYTSVVVDIPDFCEDPNSINCTYLVLGPGLQEVSYIESEGDAVVWGDVGIGSVENLLSFKSTSPVPASNVTKRSDIRSKRALTVPSIWPNAIVRYRYQDVGTRIRMKELMDVAFSRWLRMVPFLQFIEDVDPKSSVKGPAFGAVPGRLILRINTEGLCRTDIGYTASSPMILTLNIDKDIPGKGWCGIPQAVHEIGHTLSFHHEHQRSDRKTSGGITYNCDNVLGTGTVKGKCATTNGDDKTHNFVFASGLMITPYDALSIMQYESTAFAKTDPVTKAKLFTLAGAPATADIKSRQFPSRLDAERLCHNYPKECAKTGYCGDGKVQAPEQCDQGAFTAGCVRGCWRSFCGDGIVESEHGEECEPGVGVLGNRCTPLCKTLKCGDGILSPEIGEQCDDGNKKNGDGCSSTCKLEPRCGDGIKQVGEECDDGNNLNNDGCSSTCKIERCGDNIIQKSEECDDGNNIDGDGCSASCKIEKCGDGKIQGSEQCDDGNTISGDGCSSTCRLEKCGDGIIQKALGEECDDGNTIDGDGCSASCKIEKCGDGKIQGSEQCDDGNTVSGDGCSSTCMLESAKPPKGKCGDGIIQPGSGEECDDGNLIDGDGCSSTCKLEPGTTCPVPKMCGDGIIQLELGEQCDDGNTLPGDGCSSTCQLEVPRNCTTCEVPKPPRCGDGIVQLDEECDDGNNLNGDGCSSTCKIERSTTCLTCVPSSKGICGDGIIQADEECDDGNLVSGDGCSSTCKIEKKDTACSTCTVPSTGRCGDGIIQPGEDCDDGNVVSGDGCSSTCKFESTGSGTPGYKGPSNSSTTVSVLSIPTAIIQVVQGSGSVVVPRVIHCMSIGVLLSVIFYL